MEESSKIKISEIYKSLKYISSNNNFEIFENDAINHDIKVSNQLVIEKIEKFNMLSTELVASVSRNDMNSIKSNLIHLRVQSMSLASEFENIKDDIDELVKLLD